MSSVNATGGRRKPYHHGALHAALVDASIALAREGGPDRVILREAARAAGVSHSAAYRHFADREALLAEVSRHARNALAAEMRSRVKRARDPRQRLRAVGTAYVEFALTEPGLFRTAFTSHPATQTTPPEPNSDTDSGEPFEILGQALDDALAAGLLDPKRRPGAEIGAWSAVHGLANLLLDGPLPTTKAEINFSLNRVLDLVERGLLNGG
ncbi:MAG TPA: TetR/AcrR family transcriptional regulator [Mycobacterium sp.]|nr:TetR/AcrR family transcriptional regulator [Mycobacterium sp.]